MTTRLFADPIFIEHHVPSGHVESPSRIEAIDVRLEAPGFSALEHGVVTAADWSDILAVHQEAYVESIIGAAPKTGMIALDADTFMSADSLAAARCGAGASCNAVDAVFGGGADNAFCLSRPPGHHATQSRSMGFCIFNNAAVAARYAQRRHGAERVAIVDWDVHHGNGTQAIFWDDPSVFYASTHQSPLYPWTGSESEKGASGNILNVPLRAGAGSAGFREAFGERIVPGVAAMNPDLIIISAGFDAHWRDPLGELGLREEDFAWATEQLRIVADKHCDGRIVSVLEGGYDLEGLADSTAAHIAALMA